MDVMFQGELGNVFRFKKIYAMFSRYKSIITTIQKRQKIEEREKLWFSSGLSCHLPLILNIIPFHPLSI